MEFTVIVLMLALAQYFLFSMQAGAARGKAGLEAPATVGDDAYERKFRIQCNTLEQLIVFVPALLAFSYYVSPVWAQVIGAAFIIGRFIYSYGYTTDPAKRAPGMILTVLSNAVLVIGTIVGILIN